MKTIFTRVLSIVLALCTLMMVAASVVSMTALATETNTSSETSSNTGIVKDESKKVMLKQENYKVREWNGQLKQLGYQNFQYNFAKGNSVIKAETTYVFSFEYYCEVGKNGTGVFGPCAYARTNTLTSLGRAPKDMIYNEDLSKNNVIFIKHMGRHKFEAEFTTLKDQTSFAVGLMAGVDGDAYYWDFKLYEKDGDGTNLIEHGNFYGEWQNYVDEGIFKNYSTHSPESLDGLGKYSFIPFNQTIANLEYEKTLEDLEEDITSSEDTSSTVVSGNITSKPNTSSNINSSSNTSSAETSSDAATSVDTSSTEILNSSNESSNNQGSKDTANSSKANFTKPLIVAIIILVCSIVAGAAAVVVYIKFFKNKN